MKFFLSLAFIIFAVRSYGNDVMFLEHKSLELQNFDARITEMQKVKTCITAATNWAQKDKCHDDFKIKREASEASFKVKFDAIFKAKAPAAPAVKK